MRLIESPKVFLVGKPLIHTEGMLNYLREVGGEAWFKRVGFNPGAVPAAEGLVEFMGRLCYRSWEPGLNANVVKVREDRGDYLLNILRSGHGSVLEHAVFNFVIHNGSRVFTAEMNRHKAGTAVSEQSLRFVRLDNLSFWEPGGLDPQTVQEGRDLVQAFERFYTTAVAREFTDDMDFSDKKVLTSKLRRWAPLGLATEEGWSANVRAIRHVIEMRTAPGAEEEIRIIADQIGQIMVEQCPLLFGDYEFDADSAPTAWVTPNRKV
jgi:thymidylate synthase (FAD)